MHLETLQHLRSLAGQHDDLVPIAKPLLLDLLDSYEEGATIKREYMDLAGALQAHDHAEAVVKLRDLQQWCATALQAIDPACGVTESLATLRGITLGFSSRHAATPACWIPVAESMPETLVPSTFESHGHTWTRHTPGDPCPVPNPDALVYVLTSFGGPNEGKPSRAGLCGWHVIKHHNYAWGEIIGWRYAEPQPSTPDK